MNNLLTIKIQLVICAVLALMGITACTTRTSNGVITEFKIDSDGTRHVPGFKLPLSELISPEAREILTSGYMLENCPLPDWSAKEAELNASIMVSRQCWDKATKNNLARTKEIYPATIDPLEIEGTTAYNVFDVKPKEGIAPKNKGRVLIHVPGSGHIANTYYTAQNSALPIAALGRMRVVAVDYRKGPEYAFPAAIEDVISVYRELLKDYKPENIGIYGCSAGAMIAAQTVPWFEKEGLPLPGALMMAGMTGRLPVNTDGTRLYVALTGGDVPQNRETPMPGFNPYWSKSSVTDWRDPLASPFSSPETLKKFPPSLLLASSRDGNVSHITYGHSQLVKNGVDAELHVQEGLPHCFDSNPDYPESRDRKNVIVNFFVEKLGKI